MVLSPIPPLKNPQSLKATRTGTLALLCLKCGRLYALKEATVTADFIKFCQKEYCS